MLLLCSFSSPVCHVVDAVARVACSSQLTHPSRYSRVDNGHDNYHNHHDPTQDMPARRSPVVPVPV